MLYFCMIAETISITPQVVDATDGSFFGSIPDDAHWPVESLEWVVVGSIVAFHQHPYLPSFHGISDDAGESPAIDQVGEVVEVCRTLVMVKFQNSGKSYDIPVKVWNDAQGVVLINPEEVERCREAFVAKYKRKV